MTTAPVLTDAISCDWCGAEPGQRCNIQPGGELVLSAVHLCRSAPASIHEAWVATGQSAYLPRVLR